MLAIDMNEHPTRERTSRLGPPPLLARVHADGRVRAAGDRAGRRLPAVSISMAARISTAPAACGATCTATATRGSTRRFASSSIAWPTARRSAWAATRRCGWPSGWPISRRAIWSTCSFPATARRRWKSRSRWRFNTGGNARSRGRRRRNSSRSARPIMATRSAARAWAASRGFTGLFEPLLFDVIRVPMPDPRRAAERDAAERSGRNILLTSSRRCLQRITMLNWPRW